MARPVEDKDELYDKIHVILNDRQPPLRGMYKDIGGELLENLRRFLSIFEVQASNVEFLEEIYNDIQAVTDWVSRDESKFGTMQEEYATFLKHTEKICGLIKTYKESSEDGETSSFTGISRKEAQALFEHHVITNIKSAKIIYWIDKDTERNIKDIKFITERNPTTVFFCVPAFEDVVLALSPHKKLLTNSVGRIRIIVPGEDKAGPIKRMITAMFTRGILLPTIVKVYKPESTKTLVKDISKASLLSMRRSTVTRPGITHRLRSIQTFAEMYTVLWIGLEDKEVVTTLLDAGIYVDIRNADDDQIRAHLRQLARQYSDSNKLKIVFFVDDKSDEEDIINLLQSPLLRRHKRVTYMFHYADFYSPILQTLTDRGIEEVTTFISLISKITDTIQKESSLDDPQLFLPDKQEQTTKGKKVTFVLRKITCKNLKIADLESSDPYLRLKLGESAFKSPVQFRTLFPEWKDLSFEFHCITHNTLRIDIWDKDYGKADDHLGFYQIKISDIIAQHSEKNPLNPLNVGPIKVVGAIKNLIPDAITPHLRKKWSSGDIPVQPLNDKHTVRGTICIDAEFTYGDRL